MLGDDGMNMERNHTGKTGSVYRRRMIKTIFWLFLFFASNILNAQISVSNLVEYRLGNLPDREPEYMSTLYDQVQLDYFRDFLIVGLRYEMYQPTEQSRKYGKPTQRYIDWQKDWLHLRVGNFYSRLGRGLVFRSFELPGVVQEDEVNRVRYSFSRDMDGFLSEIKTKYVDATLLRGDAINNTLPPTLENRDRSLGVVEGGQLFLKPFHWLKFGGTFARYHFRNSEAFNAGSGILEFSLTPLMERYLSKDFFVDFYSEYAEKEESDNAISAGGNGSPYAFYSSANIIYKRLGISLEYKDYRDFNLRVNDPPPAVREHSFYLLNRNTHVLLPENELGFQIEATYSLDNGTTFIANYTQAENRLRLLENTVFMETFLEIDFFLSPQILVKFFIDKSKDEYFAKSIADRWTLGGEVEWQYSDFNSISFELQGQRSEKTFEFAPNRNSFDDLYASLAFLKSPNLSAGIVFQRTTDPDVTDDP
ncbi:hypothetical protein GF337_09030, partial [candidate division KSB1 bacterium]|nr:hypothetical protein [candidate division KSB1 bacterium]